MITPRSTLHSSRIAQWVVVILLLLLFAQAALTATRTSLTIDEGLHITSGYSILRTGDYRLIEEHPPLIKVLAALPLLTVSDLADPRSLRAWEGDSTTPDTVQLVRVMKQWLQPYRPFDRVIFIARVPIMLLALVLGAVVFRWAGDVAGPPAGLLALALYTLDPNMVAHSSIAAIDLGTAAFITFASYAFWRALRRPTRINVALAGVTLGLAQATKISALMLLPLFAVLAALRAITTHDPALLSGLRIGRWVHTATRGQMLVRFGLLMAVIFVLAGLTLWGTYGFEIRTPPGWSIPVPAASHLIPLERVRHDITAGRTTFLMGQYSEQGWWYYFPVALAIKTPLPTLVLLLASAALFIAPRHHPSERPFDPAPDGRRASLPHNREALRFAQGDHVRQSNRSWDALALVSFPLVYFAIAMVQPFNIGYRHLLPILPFVFVFIGVEVAGRKSQVTGHRSVTLSHLPSRFFEGCRRVPLSLGLFVSILLIWNAIGTLRLFPHYLAYFNELAGGPENGYKWLVDSNLDWGQGWKELKAYLDAHGIARIKFAQFSSNDPATYGIGYEPIAPMTGAPPVLPSRFNPAPGVYVLSASSLQGVPLADVNTYDYFRHLEPTARIGYALFVYDIRPVEPQPGWAATCASPAPPLEPADFSAGLGRDDLRQVYFDCTQSWVLPGNSSHGWILMPYALAHDTSAFSARWLSRANLTFEQKQSFEVPPFSISLTSGESAEVMQGLSPLSGSFGQTAELSGFRLDRSTIRPGQPVELLTFWRVTGQPPAMLSVMAHLVTQDDRVIAVADGLGFTADQWQEGDILIQRHLLEIPANTPPGILWAQTGLYTLDDIRRLPVTVNGVSAGDSLRLASIKVTP